MKAKTIKSVLRHKHDAWLASITDEKVRILGRHPPKWPNRYCNADVYG